MQHNAFCLVHGKKYRAEFQFVVNFLRKTVTDKSLNFASASSVVCCCKLKDDEAKMQDCQDKSKTKKIEDFFEEADLKDAMESIMKIEDVPLKVKNVLDRWKSRPQEIDGLIHYGNSRIAGLMLLVLKGNYALLQNPAPVTLLKSHFMTLPIRPSLLGVYFGQGGRNIEDLRRKYKCLIKAEKRSVGTSTILTDTKITVVCMAEQFEELQNLLIAKAQKLLDERQARRIEYRKGHQQLRTGRRCRPKQTWKPSNSPKDLAREKFIKGYRSRFMYRRRAPVMTMLKSQVMGRECYNCQMLFGSDLPDITCRHHPGFVVSLNGSSDHNGDKTGKWTCCQNIFKQGDSMAVSHQKYGCCFRATHIWRYVKRRKNCKKIR